MGRRRAALRHRAGDLAADNARAARVDHANGQDLWTPCDTHRSAIGRLSHYGTISGNCFVFCCCTPLRINKKHTIPSSCRPGSFVMRAQCRMFHMTHDATHCLFFLLPSSNPLSYVSPVNRGASAAPLNRQSALERINHCAPAKRP